MRKIILVVLFLQLNLFANIYEQNCVKCHKKMQVGIDKFFYRYLLIFSSEENVKKELKSYLANPSKEKTLFADDLMLRYGIKKKSSLTKEQLSKAVDIYWGKYNLFDKLK
ncbi:MAG: hypothetical protein CR967_03040 [Proteobacteria bacterium]|nr:MAG: hypothetical protein CR967_03040 [Pseudomonadota bacterium]